MGAAGSVDVYNNGGVVKQGATTISIAGVNNPADRKASSKGIHPYAIVAHPGGALARIGLNTKARPRARR